MAKPLGQFNPRRNHALVTILRDNASAGAFSKNREIFLSHKQPVLGQLWDIVFQFIHRLCAGNVVRQMGEEVAKHFGAQDLMNPYLVPGPSLEVNIAEWILNFAREERQPGIIQRRAASAE